MRSWSSGSPIRLGVVLNANLEDYKVPTIRDMPEIEIIMLDEANVHANTIGSLGAGEPPIIPTPGAIANAVAHAIGRPVKALPLTPARVLELLNRQVGCEPFEHVAAGSAARRWPSAGATAPADTR